jgi:radical SAM superfamily enzyme YgiQ (UPF0313 family)
MTWKIIENRQKILAGETRASVSNWGGKLTVCLVYPNQYHAAMSNLGFQAVYALLNQHPAILCERSFLPDRAELEEHNRSGAPLLSLESQRPLTDFDVVAFSVSFESDYLHIPRIFQLAGIQPFATDRSATSPLVMAGGAALFLNPEPVADFMDLICMGEAEPLLESLFQQILAGEGHSRRELLKGLAQLPGVYIPFCYKPAYAGGRLISFTNLPPAPLRVHRVWENDLDRRPTGTEILTEATEFGNMHLIEISRGCPHGCRFCAAGFIYHPYRYRSLDVLKEEVVKGLRERERIGLVGAAIADYPEINELCRHILKLGGKVSVSSLRLDRLDDEMIRSLRQSGHKTIALAPEGGSQRLRDLIKKDITEEQILAACDRLIGHDILNLKLYFIIGLPTETDADLEEMAALVNRIRDRVVAAARANKRLGEVILSVNPFVPKPFTPFQWCGMENVKSLEKKIKFLTKTVGTLANVRLNVESPKEAYLQALLSRGDRRLSALLVKAAQLGNWKRAARELGLDTDQLVYRDIPLDELLPWDFIESGSRERLAREYGKVFGENT